MNPTIESLYRELSRLADECQKLKNESIYDCGDDVLSTCFADAAEADFDGLCGKLQKEGTVLLDRTAAGNRFFAAAQGEGYCHVSFFPARGQLRIAATAFGTYLPAKLGDVPQNADERSVTQVCPDDTAGNFGMCYVFSLGAGHFLIYDGNGDLGEDHTRLYDTLLRATPAGQKPVVDAWIVTHPHWDHVSGMAKFAGAYAGAVEVRNVLCNLPALNERFGLRDIGNLASTRVDWLPKFLTAFPEARQWKLHTGQCVSVGDATVEVLYTHEDLSPWSSLPANDSSTVTAVTLAGKRFLLPADVSCAGACGWLRDVWGEALRSDFYQVAHHGWDTEALLFYDLVDAKTVLWPLRLRDWERIQKFPATRRMVREMQDGTREFLIAREECITVGLGSPGKETT